eukprot:SAG22_NODE_20645_length_264_cov_0.612121_1_plen_64_part_01
MPTRIPARDLPRPEPVVITPGIVHIKSAVDAGGQLFLAEAAARASEDPRFGPAGGFWDSDGKLC